MALRLQEQPNDSLSRARNVLDRAELAFEEVLTQPGAAPFIAHNRIETNLWSETKQAFKRFINGDCEKTILALKQWPAVSTAVIAGALQENYADEGSNRVYDHIANAVGLGEIPKSKDFRDKLSLHFRLACRKLTLSLFPNIDGHRPINDYLFQAGVAQNQLPHMAQAFIKAEKIYGPAP